MPDHRAQCFYLRLSFAMFLRTGMGTPKVPTELIP